MTSMTVATERGVMSVPDDVSASRARSKRTRHARTSGKLNHTLGPARDFKVDAWWACDHNLSPGVALHVPRFVVSSARCAVVDVEELGTATCTGQKSNDSCDRAVSFLFGARSRRSVGMKSIAFFNNKGGVGKTTLSCNIAAHFANQLNKRVLVIDCDPQCNTSQLILTDARCREVYQRQFSPGTSTLLTVMRPISEGDASIAPDTIPELSSQNRFGVDLLPGHPAMSVVEDRLSSAWNNLRAAEVGGFRITNWFPQLLAQVSARYDVAIVDMGPSLGPLTRSVLLGSEYFVTPMGCDIFSIVGIRNIGEWLARWLADYERLLEHFRDDNAEAITQYRIQEHLTVKHGFVGYTVMQYITKSREGERRATAAFEEILGQIPTVVDDSLGSFFKDGLSIADSHLGDIPNLFSLVPLAQSAHSPITSLESQDGLAGGQYKQQEVYAAFIQNVGNRLATNIELDT